MSPINPVERTASQPTGLARKGGHQWRLARSRSILSLGLHMLKPVPTCWQEYRWRHIIAATGLLLGLPSAAFLSLAWAFWVRQYGESVLFAVMSIWSILWGWSAFRVVRCPCPRCGKTWLAHQEAYLGAPRRCSSCGLSLYETP